MHILQPKKKIQCDWSDNAWYDCTFLGNYISTHFGVVSPPPMTNPWGDALLVRGCDFSKAIMHGCRLKRTDVASIKFPPWPCFTALNPDTNYLQWLPTFESIRRSLMFVEFSSKTNADAIVFHWPSLAGNARLGRCAGRR